MCGIAGFFSSENPFSQNDLMRMAESLKHRGPDAVGFFSDELCSLAHRRLSILDLDARSNQPMYSHNNRYVMVYNGEVYNYKEIANDLKLTGLKTSSDSEIILEAYAIKGTEAFKLFNGMFAIAIYDRQLKQLIVARDRIGIKPLYYFSDGKVFAFASELKALMQLNIPKLLDENAVNYFLQLGFIPAPHSIYKQIRKLNSGCFLRISNAGIEEQVFWSLNEQIQSSVINDESTAINQLEKILLSSVEWQLRSDVPVGVFLSGGIDSSLVAALTKKVSTKPVQTYSIGFNESSHDESAYSRKVSELLNTEHHQFHVTYNDALSLIEEITDVYDEPFGDPSAIPTMLVSKLASQHVKVVLSGDGGDELFFGYGAYKWAERLNNPVMKLLHNPVSNLFRLMPNRFKRVARLLDYNGSYPAEHHIFSQEQYMFTAAETSKLIAAQNNDGELSFDHNNNYNRKLSAAERQDVFDLKYYLQDDLLVKVDRASMHYSLEVRVPLLDHRLIEFAINLNCNLKLHKGESKYLLKQLLYKHLPEPLFNRPKQGFAIPVAKWLKGDLRPLMDEMLSEQSINSSGFLNFDAVNKLKTEFLNGHDYHYNRIWQLLILSFWLKKNKLQIA